MESMIDARSYFDFNETLNPLRVTWIQLKREKSHWNFINEILNFGFYVVLMDLIWEAMQVK